MGAVEASKIETEVQKGLGFQDSKAFYLLIKVLSQVGRIYLLVIPFAAEHHRRQAKIRAWKQQFQAKSIHTI
jgi:hypothetical protein